MGSTTLIAGFFNQKVLFNSIVLCPLPPLSTWESLVSMGPGFIEHGNLKVLPTLPPPPPPDKDNGGLHNPLLKRPFLLWVMAVWGETLEGEPPEGAR